MLDTSYPVTIYCPIADTERTVFFLPVKNGKSFIVYPDSFNGCEEETQAHAECEVCKKAAFEIMRNNVNNK